MYIKSKQEVVSFEKNLPSVSGPHKKRIMLILRMCAVSDRHAQSAFVEDMFCHD